MTEKVEPVIAFLEEMRAFFDKHSNVFIAADWRLSAEDYDGFKSLYKDLPQADLAEMVMAQHLKTNEIFGVMKQRSDTLMDILRDISSCKDFVAFDDLKKRARVVLMAQDMVDRGKDPEEVMKMMEEQTKGTSTSSIIVQ